MITEDYISFETAKLLKEKGFDGECSRFYMPNGHGRWKHEHYHDFDISDRIECPTLQMAMKWLREVHKIEVRVIYDNDKFSWYGACNPMNELSQILLGFNCESNSYEETCESGIKYCLENLI